MSYHLPLAYAKKSSPGLTLGLPAVRSKPNSPIAAPGRETAERSCVSAARASGAKQAVPSRDSVSEIEFSES